MTTTKEKVKTVLDALEQPGYSWRTISGIQRQTGLSLEELLQSLEVLRDRLVRAEVPGGHTLYSTREHSRKHARTVDKLLGAIKNRAF
jgi:hypothetical protein